MLWIYEINYVKKILPLYNYHDNKKKIQENVHLTLSHREL